MSVCSTCQVNRLLGSGAFGSAWLVEHSNGRLFALKSLEKKVISRHQWVGVVMREKDVRFD